MGFKVQLFLLVLVLVLSETASKILGAQTKDETCAVALNGASRLSHEGRSGGTGGAPGGGTGGAPGGGSGKGKTPISGGTDVLRREPPGHERHSGSSRTLFMSGSVVSCGLAVFLAHISLL